MPCSMEQKNKFIGGTSDESHRTNCPMINIKQINSWNEKNVQLHFIQITTRQENASLV